MAINESQKVDWLWKKLGYGVAKTDINGVKAATNESIASPLLIRGDNIWQDASQIPATKPSSSSTIVELYDDSGNGTATIEASADATATPNRTWKTNLTDWIPAEFGSTYLVKVYMDNISAAAPQTTGTQLFAAGSGNNDEWYFDYQSGVLNFIGDNLPSGISGKIIYVVGARFVGNKGTNLASANIGNFTFNNNTMGVSNANGDIILDPDGTGKLSVLADNVTITGDGALTLPVGTTVERPTPNAQGMIRYNTTDSTFEGYDGANWGSLGGVKDVDQDTYILAESSAGADNDQLDFYTAGTQRFQIGATGDFKFGDTLTEVTIAGATGDTVIGGTLNASETTLASATVSDLTATRVVIAGTAGAVEDSANLTFNGSILAVTGAATISTTLGVTGIASLDGGIEVRNTANNGEAFTVAVGTGNTVIAGTVAANSTGDSLTVADTLRIAQTGSGLRMTNVGGFDNDGSDNFRVFGTNDLILAANGDSGTAITIDAANQNVEITNDLVVTGDLTVSGTTTYINTTTLNIGDNIITLNADITNLTAPTENAGIEVLRGTGIKKSFIWDETADNWTAGTDTIIAGTFEGSIDGGTF
jgi:hypothetical protein